ncbi:MAG: flagellar protein FlgN [Lachnospiraceae bacterium]|nr:flagellar protein FlgN [Lachnospiraceae bacterium]
MASLIEELITVLDEEEKKYRLLTGLAGKKTPVIVEGNIEKLQIITDEEQKLLDDIAALDKKREEVTADIAGVINTDVNTLKLSILIEVLERRPKEHDALSAVYDRLKGTIGELRVLNEQNRILITQQLDMIDFNLSLDRAMREAPETGNYNRHAGISGDMMGSASGGFDAKQ